VTWTPLIPALIGILAALGIVLRAVPPAADRIVTAFTSLVETHTSIYADLRRELADCREKHDAADLRIDALEAGAREMGAEITRRDDTIAHLKSALNASHGETRQLRADIRSSRLTDTTDRGQKP
jgi:chromosome segregation ATPase